MTSLYTHQAQNVRKTWFIMFVFLVIVVAVGWFASEYFGNPIILIAAVGFSLVMNVSSFWFSSKIAITAAGAKIADEKEYRDLHNTIENLAITAGLPKPKIYVINESAPNAFATGRNPENAAIAVTTGLLQALNKVELEGVLAHELSHIGNRDILVMSVVVVLVGFIAVISDILWHVTLFGGNRDRDNSNPVLMIAGIALIVLGPVIAQIMQLAVSRKREFLADASGALLTRYPEGLASALEKIGAYQQPMKKASSATAHMFIGNPFGRNGKKGNTMRKLFSTHPPMEERIAALIGK
ncbi:zinc metalloprotease HtpX [Candidatus Kaiserbacteria bacterium]|nr:MAG: zinc metalloprotease HtpX [Candidatus Kaiserbacteria bacterium]